MTRTQFVQIAVAAARETIAENPNGLVLVWSSSDANVGVMAKQREKGQIDLR